MDHFRIARLTTFALALTLTGACANDPHRTLPPLVVASDLDNLPFAGVDAEGNPVGRDVEMMEELAERIDRELEWQRMPFDELLPAAEAGRVDVVCATIGISPERAERVAFTRPYFRTKIAIVVRAGPGEPDSTASLARRRVAAARGTTSEVALVRQLPAAIPFLDQPEWPGTDQLLRTGIIDAAVMDGPAADTLVAANAGVLRRLPEDLASEDYALALPLSHEGLRRRLNQSLEEMRLLGWMRALDERYGLAPTADE